MYFPSCAKEFVSRDLHIHRTRMDFGQLAAIGADGPDAVDLMPGPS